MDRTGLSCTSKVHIFNALITDFSDIYATWKSLFFLDPLRAWSIIDCTLKTWKQRSNLWFALWPCLHPSQLRFFLSFILPGGYSSLLTSAPDYFWLFCDQPRINVRHLVVVFSVSMGSNFLLQIGGYSPDLYVPRSERSSLSTLNVTPLFLFCENPDSSVVGRETRRGAAKTEATTVVELVKCSKIFLLYSGGARWKNRQGWKSLMENILGLAENVQYSDRNKVWKGFSLSKHPPLQWMWTPLIRNQAGTELLLCIPGSGYCKSLHLLLSIFRRQPPSSVTLVKK